MDSDNSQQSTPRLRHNRVKARKLRMSCDACASSKIKCCQSRPVCSRCQKLNLKCNYSPSRRMGRRPVAPRDLANPAKYWKSEQGSRTLKATNDELQPGMRDSQNASIESMFHSNPMFSAIDMPLLPYTDADVTSASWHGLMAGANPSTCNLSMMTPPEFDQDFNLVDTSISQLTLMESVYDVVDFGEEMIPDSFDSEPQPIWRHSSLDLPIAADPLLTPPYSEPSARSPNCPSISPPTLYRNLDSKTNNTYPICTQSATSSPEHAFSTLSPDPILIPNKYAIEKHIRSRHPYYLSNQSRAILTVIIDKVIAQMKRALDDPLFPPLMVSPTQRSSSRAAHNTAIRGRAAHTDAARFQRSSAQGNNSGRGL
ncbi:hypothetical protein F5884DRAFT_855702 [Xylogone sp. PMI_703]|nr:hypothetical protein F5884DRAFT_855702 [Xylogone sp. PMI_703]